MSKEQQKSMSVLLVVSLCFNLFLGGLLLGGSIVKHRSGDFRPPEGYAPPLRSLLSPRDVIHKVSPDLRDQVKDLARQNLHELRPQLEKVHAARVLVFELLAAEELDKPALKDAIEALANAEREAQIASGETMIEMLELVPQEDRKKLLKEDRPWRHHHGHGDRKPRLHRGGE